MKIEFGAFTNCVSLKEIHFEKCTEPINTDIYNCNVSEDLKIIVNDKLYSDFIKTEIKANHYRLTLYSDYIQELIDNFKNSNIILSIILLLNCLKYLNSSNISEILKNVIKYLTSKYLIYSNSIKYIELLIQKKEDIKNGS